MIIYLVIVLAAASRFVPHLPNFAPITALAIFSAAHLGWKKSAALTLAARFASDLFLGFFAWPLMLAVYGSHLFGVALGCWIKKSLTSPLAPLHVLEKENPNPSGQETGKVGEGLRKWGKILASGVISAAVFFLVTNFAFFYPSYPHTWAGIAESYANGLPFLRGTLWGDAGYTLALFAAYEAAMAAYQNRVNLSKWLRV